MTILHETDEYTVIHTETPTGETIEFRPKPGSSEANRASLEQNIKNAIATLEEADANWATLTSGQRADAMRLAVRATAKTSRLITNRLEAT